MRFMKVKGIPQRFDDPRSSQKLTNERTVGLVDLNQAICTTNHTVGSIQINIGIGP